MQPTYMPNVEAAFPEKNRLRVSVRASSPPSTVLSMYLFIMKPASVHAYEPHHLHAFAINVGNLRVVRHLHCGGDWIADVHSVCEAATRSISVDLINLKLVLVYKCRKLRSSWWSCTLWCAATTTCCWPSWSSRHSCAPSSSLRGARWCRLADPSLLVSLARVQAGCISLSAAACVHRLFVCMCLVHIFSQHCDATRSSLAPQCCRTI